MSKRHDIAAAARKIFDDAEESHDENPLVDILTDENQPRILLIPIDHLEPNPDQPRKHFDQGALEDLAASIQGKGILQPLIARRNPNQRDHCILIAGERRWRAAKIAGLKTVPVLLRTPDDSQEIAIIENLQRENLSALEEAEALAKLKQTKSYTDEQLAKIIGKSRVAVTESLSLNKLPNDIKAEARMSNVRQWSKIQLLQVFRAGSPEKVRATWDALKGGESPTVRALKERKEATTTGRPKHYTFTYRPDDKHFRLMLTFTKARVSSDEIKAALREALRHQA